jgi:hypothetical protein
VATFKKISGNYIKVLNRSGLPPCFAEPQDPETRKEQIEKDLPRGAFVDVNGRTFNDLKNTWSDPSAVASYTQGDMDARVFSVIYDNYIFNIDQQSQSANCSVENLFEKKQDLSFAYYDDTGTACGFSIVYHNDETNPSLQSIAIIHNTTADPADRVVTCYCAFDLIQDPGDTLDPLTEAQVSSDLWHHLNSSSIQRLIQSVLSDSGQINFEKLNTLRNRIKVNHNLDDRDVRKLQLDELIAYGEKYLPDSLLFNQHVSQIRQNAAYDIDFFESTSFKSVLLEISKTIELEVNQLPTDLMSDQRKANTLLAIDYTLQAVNFERQGYNSSEHYESERCKNEAVLLWRKRDVIYNILKFREALDALKSNNTYPELHLKGLDVLKEIESIIKLPQDSILHKDFLDIDQVVTSCINIINEPKNTEHIDNLKKLSQTVSGKQSLLWQALGVALIVFVNVAIIVTGLLGALPTGGLSLVLGAAGVSALLAGGVGSIKHGAEHGLAASVSGFFKASSARNKEDDARNVLHDRSGDELNIDPVTS